MYRTELENLIRFTKMNGMMNWMFEEVLNEYETTKMHHKEPKFDPKTFQPFDKVLVRDDSDEVWIPTFFRCINPETNKIITLTLSWSQCIPYNKETKHLSDTIDNCPDYYKWWEE